MMPQVPGPRPRRPRRAQTGSKCQSPSHFPCLHTLTRSPDFLGGPGVFGIGPGRWGGRGSGTVATRLKLWFWTRSEGPGGAWSPPQTLPGGTLFCLPHPSLAAPKASPSSPSCPSLWNRGELGQRAAGPQPAMGSLPSLAPEHPRLGGQPCPSATVTRLAFLSVVVGPHLRAFCL